MLRLAYCAFDKKTNNQNNFICVILCVLCILRSKRVAFMQDLGSFQGSLNRPPWIDQ